MPTIEIPDTAVIAAILIGPPAVAWVWALSPHALTDWADRRGIQLLPRAVVPATHHVRSIRIGAAGAITLAWAAGFASIQAEMAMAPWMAAALGFLVWVSVCELSRSPIGSGRTRLVERRTLDYTHRSQVVLSSSGATGSVLLVAALPSGQRPLAAAVAAIALVSATAGWLLVGAIVSRRYQVSDAFDDILEDALRRDSAVLVAGASTVVLVAATVTNLSLLLPDTGLVQVVGGGAAALAFGGTLPQRRPPAGEARPAS
ncbi:MAG: hypothetical protein ACFCVC_09865 [Acidimicrobiia bacterium]